MNAVKRGSFQYSNQGKYAAWRRRAGSSNIIDGRQKRRSAGRRAPVAAAAGAGRANDRISGKKWARDGAGWTPKAAQQKEQTCSSDNGMSKIKSDTCFGMGLKDTDDKSRIFIPSSAHV
jgi:hypothetical protein